MKPFLKWAGGKRQLLDELRSRAPNSFRCYYEPFVGGGALFFSLEPQKAVLSDINEELINVYEVLRDDVQALISSLAEHEDSEEYFYSIRSLDREERYASCSKLERASRMIYLNRACYNGLYRVNSRGQFNVPFGHYKRLQLPSEGILRACSQQLQHTELRVCSFEALEKEITPEDFVYLDPPYVPVSDTAHFTSYSRSGFGPADQRRLQEFCARLTERGVRFLLSNSATEEARELYTDFTIEVVHAARAVNSVATGRGKVEELLVRNY